MTLLPTWRTWPVWARVLYGALLLYAALLCGVSLFAFIQSQHPRWNFELPDFTFQALITLFLPTLLIGLRRPRIASGLLFLGLAIDIVLTIVIGRSKSDLVRGLALSNVLFVGFPMLGSALFLHRQSRKDLARATT